MTTALIILVAIMGVAALGMMSMAVCEFMIGLRQSRGMYYQVAPEQQPAPAPVQAAPAPAPVEEPAPAEEQPAPVAEEPVCEEVTAPAEEAPAAPAEETPAEEDDDKVSFEAQTVRLTLKEAYDALKKVDQRRYDKIVKAASELELARTIESTYAFTVMQGRDTIARLRIMRGIVTLDCTVINAELAKYNKENGKKIRNKPTRFRIREDAELDAAIFTMQVANQASLENRNVRRAAKAEEGKEA